MHVMPAWLTPVQVNTDELLSPTVSSIVLNLILNWKWEEAKNLFVKRNFFPPENQMQMWNKSVMTKSHCFAVSQAVQLSTLSSFLNNGILCQTRNNLNCQGQLAGYKAQPDVLLHCHWGLTAGNPWECLLYQVGEQSSGTWKEDLPWHEIPNDPVKMIPSCYR